MDFFIFIYQTLFSDNKDYFQNQDGMYTSFLLVPITDYSELSLFLNTF